MGRNEARSELNVDLYLRSVSPTGAQTDQEIVARLERLEERAVIDDFTVSVWGEHVYPDAAAARTDAGRTILERIDAIHSWADRNGMSVDSFTAREVESTMTGEAYERITLPVMALVEYRRGALQFVAPCTNGDAHYTVADRLAALERGETDVTHGE
ncbi:HTH domain-containing protein [Haloplanus sp. GCM10025708]|uniref:HTH domain-containing protein n=1 Tax=Haloferacaceae TaxID=1644056 RepID=UPI0036068292